VHARFGMKADGMRVAASMFVTRIRTSSRKSQTTDGASQLRATAEAIRQRAARPTCLAATLLDSLSALAHRRSRRLYPPSNTGLRPRASLVATATTKVLPPKIFEWMRLALRGSQPDPRGFHALSLANWAAVEPTAAGRRCAMPHGVRVLERGALRLTGAAAPAIDVHSR
jgi:hypothetical protein